MEGKRGTKTKICDVNFMLEYRLNFQIKTLMNARGRERKLGTRTTKKQSSVALRVK